MLKTLGERYQLHRGDPLGKRSNSTHHIKDELGRLTHFAADFMLVASSRPMSVFRLGKTGLLLGGCTLLLLA